MVKGRAGKKEWKGEKSPARPYKPWEKNVN